MENNSTLEVILDWVSTLPSAYVGLKNDVQRVVNDESKRNAPRKKAAPQRKSPKRKKQQDRRPDDGKSMSRRRWTKEEDKVGLRCLRVCVCAVAPKLTLSSASPPTTSTQIIVDETDKPGHINWKSIVRQLSGRSKLASRDRYYKTLKPQKEGLPPQTRNRGSHSKGVRRKRSDYEGFSSSSEEDEAPARRQRTDECNDSGDEDGAWVPGG